MSCHFSIVICTYNPDERLLARSIRSVLNQRTSMVQFECVIVDNNSSVPIQELDCVRQLAAHPQFKVILESRPGLSHARIAGVNHSQAPVIIFVDDDNELSEEYLQNLKELLDAHPDVASWGPGIIHVDYIDGAPSWIRDHFSALFQEKNLVKTQYGCVAGWPDYYPAGSGLVIKREVFNQYISLYEKGILTATDRNGNSMASAGDSQIVWTAIKMGLSAGTSPLLKLTHIIPAKRLSVDYLKKLNYGVSNSYYKALQETFPGTPKPFKKRSFAGRIAFMFRIALEAKINPVLFFRMYTVKNAWVKGYEDIA